jgi:hypothetical protein
VAPHRIGELTVDELDGLTEPGLLAVQAAAWPLGQASERGQGQV